MSSNYKYKNQPLDEIAATYNEYFKNKNSEVHNNIINNMCFKMSDNGFNGDDTLYIRKTDTVANGLWGNDITDIDSAYSYSDNNIFPFTNRESVIFNGLNLSNYKNNSIIDVSTENFESFTISYDDDNGNITYEYNGEYYIAKNKHMHIICVQADGGNGGSGKKDEIFWYPDNMSGNAILWYSQAGGGGGGGGAFAAILVDVSKLKKIAICKYDSYISIDVYDKNNLKNAYMMIYNGTNGKDVQVHKSYSLMAGYPTQKSNTVRSYYYGTGGTGGKCNKISNAFNYAIYDILLKDGCNGGDGGRHNSYLKLNNTFGIYLADMLGNRNPIAGGSNTDTIIKYDNNNKIFFTNTATTGGTIKNDSDADTSNTVDCLTEGGGGGASFSSNGGSTFRNGNLGSGGAGSKSGGLGYIRVYTEKLDGTYDFSNISWESVN